MFVVSWNHYRPDLQMSWKGPARITNAIIPQVEEITRKLSVISGPRGEKGEKGDAGEVGGIPVLLDGGNF